jgi:hypothetical protein
MTGSTPKMREDPFLVSFTCVNLSGGHLLLFWEMKPFAAWASTDWVDHQWGRFFCTPKKNAARQKRAAPPRMTLPEILHSHQGNRNYQDSPRNIEKRFSSRIVFFRKQKVVSLRIMPWPYGTKNINRPSIVDSRLRAHEEHSIHGSIWNCRFQIWRNTPITASRFACFTFF